MKHKTSVRTGRTSGFDLQTALFFGSAVLAMVLLRSPAALILAAAAMVSFLSGTSAANLKDNFSLSALGLLLFVLASSLTSVLSDFGFMSGMEFVHLLAAFAVSVLFLAWFRRDRVPALLWGLAVISAVVAILGTDAACKGPLFTGFYHLADLLGTDYSEITRQMDGRINGIYNNANVTGSLLAVGTILSLHLFEQEKNSRRRRGAAVLLAFSATGFFLSMSRGAIACFAAALLIWLAAAPRGRRLHLFLIMFFSAAATVLISIPLAFAIRHTWIAAWLIPLAAAVLFLLSERFLVRPLQRFLEVRTKAAVLFLAVLIAGCAVYLAAAVSVTGPAEVLPADVFRRAVSLPAGSYTVTGDWEGAPQAVIRVRPQEDVLMGRWNEVYCGPLEDAAFRVPENTAQIQVELDCDEPITLRTVIFSDGTELNLGYPLLPAFAADRIQDGLLKSANVLQRGQFVRDALKIFMGSPLVGWGPGSVGELYSSVQPFLLESRYVHNHILQVMCDSGVLGLLPFLLFLVGSLLAILRGLRKDRDPLAVMLLACWFMINLHGLMEVSFSVRGYQAFVYPLLLLPGALYRKKEPKPAVRKLMVPAVAAVLALTSLPVLGHEVVSFRKEHSQPASFYEGISAFQKYAWMDPYGRDDHKLNYIANAVASGEDAYRKKAAEYAEDLKDSVYHGTCFGLARNYYLPLGDMDSTFELSRRGIAQRASEAEVWNLQLLFYRSDVAQVVTPDNVDDYLAGVQATADYLADYSKDHWEEIALEKENRALLELVRSVLESGATGKDAYTALFGTP